MKNIVFLFLLMLAISLAGCKQGTKTSGESAEAEATEQVLPNALTNAEKTDGWQLLFDGTTSAGWRGYLKESFPAGWEVVDGTLHCKASGRGEAGGVDGGDIIYDKQFQNFHLKLEWKISEGGNSGIFYLGQESKEFEFIYYTAPEMQVLDNERHLDANLGKDGNRKAGSLYDLIPAVPQNARPAGEWNSAEIQVYQGTVIHSQNGEKVLEYHLWTPAWNELVAGSKFPELNPKWAEVAAQGYFALQDHGNDVWFRNIKIKEL
jgi:hypothetical protein